MFMHPLTSGHAERCRPNWYNETVDSARREIPMFRTFLAKFCIFTHLRQKIPIFGIARDICRHNFVTAWPILVIDVSMVRGDHYLSIDTTTKFIETLVAKINKQTKNTKTKQNKKPKSSHINNTWHHHLFWTLWSLCELGWGQRSIWFLTFFRLMIFASNEKNKL